MKVTFKECCEMIAKKYNLGKTLVTGHKYSYFEEAAELYLTLNLSKNG